eukprot:RCo048805
MGNSMMLPIPLTSKVVHRLGNAHFKAAVVSLQGYRSEMEDSHAVALTERYGFLGVFDGHSGAACSKFCSKAFPEAVAAAGPPPLEDSAVTKMVAELDQRFLRETELDDGCTATFCIATPGQKAGTWDLQIGNVGDSRVVVARGAVPAAVTKDHKPTDPAEEARIKAAGGFVAMERVVGDLALSRAMGDRPYKCILEKVRTPKPGAGATAQQDGKKRPRRAAAAGSEAEPSPEEKLLPRPASNPEVMLVTSKPDITRFTCKASDVVLLACDGIFEPESFTTEEVVKFLHAQLQAKGGDLGEVLCALCDEALRRGSTDNMTAVLLQFGDGTGHQGKQFLPGRFAQASRTFHERYFAFAKEEGGLSAGEALRARRERGDR